MEDYFRTISKKYHKRSLEVQKKAKYLFVVNLIGGGLILILLLSQFFTSFGPRDFIGQFMSMLLILMSVIYLFNGKIYTAGFLSILGLNGIIFFEYVLADYFAPTVHYLRVYESLSLILIGFALISLFAIRRTQIILFSILSFTSLLIHLGFAIEKRPELSIDNTQMVIALSNALVVFFSGMTICYFLMVKSHNLVKNVEVSRNKAQLKYKLLFNNMHTAYINLKMIRDKDNLITDAIVQESNSAFHNLCKLSSKDIEQRFLSQLPSDIQSFFGNLNILMEDYEKNNQLILEKSLGKEEGKYQIQFYTLKQDSLVALIFKTA